VARLSEILAPQKFSAGLTPAHVAITILCIAQRFSSAYEKPGKHPRQHAKGELIAA
jgi:hypothetical protein